MGLATLGLVLTSPGEGVESGKRIIVGVNKYQTEEELPIQLMKVDMEVQRTKIERLKEFRQKRNQNELGEALKQVEKIAASNENIMPGLINAVKAKATLSFVPRLQELLQEKGLQDIKVVVGGIIPRDDIDLLKKHGVCEIFLPGAPSEVIIERVKNLVG